jgi:hypothetical protein
MISAFALFSALIAALFITPLYGDLYMAVALLSALFTLYRATKTTNLYKKGYYLIFINAPLFVLLSHSSLLYTLSLLLSLLGIYLIAGFYERHYRSANYYSITGVLTTTPYVGIFLKLYLITLALYPPFPNATFFLSGLLASDLTLIGSAAVIVVFFANFTIAMRIITQTLFGKANRHIHYVDFTSNEKAAHLMLLVILLTLSGYGFMEMIS